MALSVNRFATQSLFSSIEEQLDFEGECDATEWREFWGQGDKGETAGTQFFKDEAWWWKVGLHQCESLKWKL